MAGRLGHPGRVAARTSYAVGALAAVAVAVTALAIAVGGRAAEPPPARRPEPAPAVVLAAWDAQRARAWATGDEPGLRRLYVAGSTTGRRDTAMLRRYLARGLRVEGLQVQRLSVAVLSHTDARWVLRVRDRVAGGAVVGAGVRVPLPRDRPSLHRVTLVREGGAWRVSEVRPAGPSDRQGVRPAPPR